MTRDLDVTVHGATGFVGRLTAAHLARTAGPEVRIGLSGRSLPRLEEVRASLGPAAADWPLVVADAADRASLDALAARSTVVATTVGPYARHGLPLVQACAEAGTHYADLTGEVTFVRASIDAAHEQAVASGARIVHACGFDSVPSDLGVLLLQEQARADGAGELGETTFVVKTMKGGASGGTIDSARLLIDTARKDPAARRLLLDPYSLSPDRSAEPDPGDGRDTFAPAYSRELGWTAPFLMGPFNTRIVRRSNALTDWSYGRAFRYREVMATGPTPVGPLVAAGITAGLGGLGAGLLFPPTRALLDRVLPKPGTGPSPKVQETGHFTVEVSTTTTTGARYVSTVAAKGDPGYAATAVMLGQSALALAGGGLPERAGVLTPATALGPVLVERLRAAGFTLGVRAA